jgi:hypothetical protein
MGSLAREVVTRVRFSPEKLTPDFGPRNAALVSLKELE